MLTAFADPVFDSQRTFRQLLQAMARPAEPRSLPVLPPSPASIAPAAMAILLTLCDASTLLWLQQPDEQALQHLRFHGGMRFTDQPKQADFALISDASQMPALEQFAHGEMRYPDRSTSVIVQVEGFTGNDALRFAGPGIRNVATLPIQGLPQDIWQQRTALSTQFPLGIDLYFVAGQQVVALPRTTRLLES